MCVLIQHSLCYQYIGSSAQTKDRKAQQFFSSKSDVPAPPINTAVGGKASLQPKRTPVTDKEIDAILVSEKSNKIEKDSKFSFHGFGSHLEGLLVRCRIS